MAYRQNASSSDPLTNNHLFAVLNGLHVEYDLWGQLKHPCRHLHQIGVNVHDNAL